MGITYSRGWRSFVTLYGFRWLSSAHVKVLLECRCRLDSEVPWGVRSSASEPISWDPDSPGPPFSAATALGAQWAKAWAAACELAVCSALAPVREDGCGVKQHEMCSPASRRIDWPHGLCGVDITVVARMVGSSNNEVLPCPQIT